MDFPILIIWMSPLSFLGAFGAIFHFHLIFHVIHVSKQNSPRWVTTFAASHLGLFCLQMSRKKDARLIWVKVQRESLPAGKTRSGAYLMINERYFIYIVSSPLLTFI